MNDLGLVLEALERCEGVSSRTEKLQFLNEVYLKPLPSYVLAGLFQSVFDPFTTYGIHVGEVEGEGVNEPEWNDFESILNKLSSRELSGGAARTTVTSFLRGCKPLYAKWLGRVLGRNLKCGVSVGTVNSLYPGLLRSFGVQLATAWEPGTALPESEYLCEAKLDGIRGIVVPGTGVTLSRSGKPLYNTELIHDELKLFKGYVVDGEFLADDWNSTASIVRSSKKQVDNSSLRFCVFDIIPEDEFQNGVTSQDQRQRSEFLDEMVKKIENRDKVKKLNQFLVSTSDEAEALAQKFVKEGYEGAILKDPDAPYGFNRSANWLKVKFTVTEEVVVVDANPGQGRLSETLGALVVLNADQQQFNCGGKLSDKDREMLWDLHQRGQLVGKVVEVMYEKAPRIVGRFPRFVRLRDDKIAKDVIPGWAA